MRYRRSANIERQQIKWFAFAASFVALSFAVAPVYFWRPSSPAFLWTLVFGLRFISRTLSYAVVTASLVAAYVALVVVFQTVTRPVTGRSDLAIAASTLIVAALFVPLRRRVQSAVDHRFNRRRYDAAKTVETFSARLRDEIDMDALRAEFVDVVQRTMQPSSASLWLRQT